MLSVFGIPRRKAVVVEPSSQPIPSLAELARARDLPTLTSDQLIDLLQLHPRLRAIASLLAWAPEDFELLCMDAIRNLVACAQLAPASESHHHADLGGLIIHTLDVIEHALRQRNGTPLPNRASPEQVNACSQRWSYAVFVACLLHDPGKLATSIRLLPTQPESAHPWSPFGAPLTAARYRIVFDRQARYRLHQTASLALFSILVPAQGRAWLTEDTECFSALLAAIADPADFEAGALGTIVQDADARSCAADMGLSLPLRRAARGSRLPLAERLMRGLRAVVPTLPTNRPGASVFVDGNTVWLMAKTVMDVAVDWLAKQGDTSIPSDRDRLFDALQDYGLLVVGEDNRAIRQIEVTIGTWCTEFRVLAMPVHRLFRAGTQPESLQGGVKWVEAKSAAEREPLEGTKQVAVQDAASESATSSSTHDDTPGDLVTQTAVTTGAVLPPGDAVAFRSTGTFDIDNDDALLPPELAGPIEPVRVSRHDILDMREAQAGSEARPAANEGPGDVSPKRQIGTAFVSWLSEQIEAGGMPINTPDAPVHGHADGLLLVSPRILKRFVSDAEGMDWTAVQKALGKERIILRTGKHTVHRYPVLNASGEAVAHLSCMVIPQPAQWLRRVPAINSALGARITKRGSEG